MNTQSNHAQNAPIVIGNTEIIPLFYQGQAVITLAMMDKVHSRPEGTAGRNFRQHRDKMIEGEDFYSLEQPDEIRRVGLAREDGSTPASITLLTETGYLLLVKSFTDELAWKIQRQLVKAYFSVKRQVPQQHQADETLTPNDHNNLQRRIWCVSGYFHFKDAWVQGCWRTIRLASNTPSPHKFRVADLPLIAAELRRIWAVSNAASHFIRQAESAFLKKVLRDGVSIESVLAEQQAALVEALKTDAAVLDEQIKAWQVMELAELTERKPSTHLDYGVLEVFSPKPAPYPIEVIQLIKVASHAALRLRKVVPQMFVGQKEVVSEESTRLQKAVDAVLELGILE